MAVPVTAATAELCDRLLATYTSIACLRRPVSEESRLLCASEISALDGMMVTARQGDGERVGDSKALEEMR